MQKLEIGNWGETQACNYLEQLGYLILERNWRIHHLEIDIIATMDKQLIFIEVKTRTTWNYGDPFLEISASKMEKIQEAADLFVLNYKEEIELRFDVIIIVKQPFIRIKHIENAF